MKINKLKADLDVHVVRNHNFSYDLLLARMPQRSSDWYKMKTFEHGVRDTDHDRLEKITPGKGETLRNPIRENNETSQVELEMRISAYDHMKLENLEPRIEHLSNEMKIQVMILPRKHANVFAADKFDVGTVKNYIACIKLQRDQYVAENPYRFSIPDREEIENQISKLLERKLNLVRHPRAQSHSPTERTRESEAECV